MARSRWKETELLIQQSKEILEREHPMTIRQLFYRLVSIPALENTRADYQRLSRIMTDARKEYEIKFDWIVDRSKPEYIPNVWDNLGQYIKSVGWSYRKNRWQDQPYHVEVWLEKDSLTGSVEGSCRHYGVTLRAHRGFSSTTKKHEIAEFFQVIGKPKFILYVGDHDSSGVDIERDLRDALREHGSGDFSLIRIAILKEDISEFKLPPLRVKEKDPRTKGFKAKYGSDVIEADALPPNELRSRLETAIRNLIDLEKWERAGQVEKAEFDSIEKIVGQYNGLK